MAGQRVTLDDESTERCTCIWDSGGVDFECPVHGESVKQCPRCGSGSRSVSLTWGGCSHSWHDQPTPEAARPAERVQGAEMRRMWRRWWHRAWWALRPRPLGTGDYTCPGCGGTRCHAADNMPTARCPHSFHGEDQEAGTQGGSDGDG